MVKQNLAKERLERNQEQDRRDEEIRLAHDLLQAYPELTYGEALKHAFAKLRKERRNQLVRT